MIKHIAIIPDGNRHWARANNLPNVAGYPQALTVIERCCYWAIENNISYLSFYCYSTENFERRPRDEYENFIKLFTEYYDNKLDFYVNSGIKVHFNGRKDRLPENIFEICDKVEQTTINGTNLTLIFCIDYGGRNEIVEAIAAGATTEQEINAYMNRIFPDPDIVIRTNNIRRVSNFMLWQISYSELFFLEPYFPDLTMEDLDAVIEEFNNKRERYYGGY